MVYKSYYGKLSKFHQLLSLFLQKSKKAADAYVKVSSVDITCLLPLAQHIKKNAHLTFSQLFSLRSPLLYCIPRNKNE